MESKFCMNAACRAVISAEWKKGWDLRSGGFATLCFNCGYAYENMAFCDTFHLEETGWRECNLCKKRLHCGCIASKTLLELLEFGGVGCSSCARSYQPHPTLISQVSNDIDTSTIKNVGTMQSTSIPNIVDSDTVSKDTLLQLGPDTISKEKLLQWTQDTVTKENGLQSGADDVGNEKPFQFGLDAVTKEKVLQVGSEAVNKEKRLHLGKNMERNESGHFPPPSTADRNSSNGIIKQENFMPSMRDGGPSFLSLLQPSGLSSKFSKPNNNSPSHGDKDMYELFRQPSMSMTLSSPSEAPNFKPSFLSGVVDGKELIKAHSSFQQGQRSRPILPKPSKIAPNASLETSKSPSLPVRVARPPGEGRGGNQLLPRYWPRITDEELLLLSAELKSAVVPLFEKVLSASDAGRIGRLVLPKACAEAYFPPIIQSEGLPVRVQDAKGKEWIFQFRFWPNNNSRMYVLEGVTPCIQSMQLEAGDTVTFSRMDPGGKLVIGSRKATGVVDMQDGETSALPNGGTPPGELPLSSMPQANGFSGLFLLPNEFKDPDLLYDHPSVTDENVSWIRSEKLPKDNSGKKKTRNILGSKSKRLLIDSDDVMELRFTWEEAQDLLRPPPSVKPKIVSIEDHEIEEYDEPPVFGKRTLFTIQASGEQEQWAQCDNCSKWRRLPVDFLLPSKWTCLDNVWDPSRCSCSAPDDMSPKEVENLFKPSKSFKRRRTTDVVQDDHMVCGLDALASAAIQGENVSDSCDGSIGATTKHPRHRPGCTCIVCIQPPSGKGKHKRTCTCNACLTVKRRFETMMNRKKSRQIERDAELAQKDDTKMIGPSIEQLYMVKLEMNEKEMGGNGHIDLNFKPDHREDVQHEANGMSMSVDVTGFPLENNLKQNRLQGLAACSQSLPQGIEQQTENCLPDHLENDFKSEDCKRGTEGDADEMHSEHNLGKVD